MKAPTDHVASRQPCELTLVHYSAEPLESLKETHPRPHSDVYFKPIGLWVSVVGEYDWKSWCDAESFGENQLAYCDSAVPMVKTHDRAHVLVLRMGLR